MQQTVQCTVGQFHYHAWWSTAFLYFRFNSKFLVTTSDMEERKFSISTFLFLFLATVTHMSKLCVKRNTTPVPSGGVKFPTNNSPKLDYSFAIEFMTRFFFEFWLLLNFIKPPSCQNGASVSKRSEIPLPVWDVTDETCGSGKPSIFCDNPYRPWKFSNAF